MCACVYGCVVFVCMCVCVCVCVCVRECFYVHVGERVGCIHFVNLELNTLILIVFLTLTLVYI